jgi:hypothetical protein
LPLENTDVFTVAIITPVRVGDIIAKSGLTAQHTNLETYACSAQRNQTIGKQTDDLAN